MAILVGLSGCSTKGSRRGAHPAHALPSDQGSRCGEFTPTRSGSPVYFGTRRFAELVDVRV